MKKKEVAPDVFLTEEEVKKLQETFGSRLLQQKVSLLSRQKQTGDKRKEMSDYHSLRTQGMQKVQPIRELEAIDRMKRALKRDSLRNYFMFVLGLNTGMRISDILPLQVKDVRNKTHIRVKETKTRKSGTFRINRELWQDIADYTEDMQDEEYLFPSRKTNLPLTRVQAYRILRKAADKAGIEQIGTHSMRKTLGYHFYNQTKDVAVLQEIFNHSTPAITKDYIGITQKEIDDKMDNFYL